MPTRKPQIAIARSRDADVLTYIICGLAMAYILQRIGDPGQWTRAAAQVGTALVAGTTALIALRARRVPPTDRPFYPMLAFVVGFATFCAATLLASATIFAYGTTTSTPLRVVIAGVTYLLILLGAVAVTAGAVVMATGIIRTFPTARTKR